MLDFVLSKLGWVPPGVAAKVEKRLTAFPVVDAVIQKEYAAILENIEGSLKPYQSSYPTYSQIPKAGLTQETVLAQMEGMSATEEKRWQAGFASGAVYHGQEDHIAFLDRVYALNSQSNPLHVDLWPSTAKYEREIVAMTAAMLGAGSTQDDPDVGAIGGVVSSGGTESILLAMKAYRDWARDQQGITEPEMIIPITAHAAFDKAAQYFNIKPIRIPVDDSYQADVQAAERALNKNSIVLVGSAPSFPHGIVDPIRELSELARAHGIGFHTDACLGGFILPWAEKLGYPVPSFDFRLPGVTSISADTHKYGYAAKGTSVILYRGNGLRHYQYFVATDWPGGLYYSPTFAGSRPGGLSAACWAAMITLGEDGYLDATRRILETATIIKEGLAAIPELEVLGDPLWVIAFQSPSLDIYRVMDEMSVRGWSLNGLQNPPCIHLCVTLTHTQPGIAHRFLDDLQQAVQTVQQEPPGEHGMAPVYGLANSLPFRGVVVELLKRYVDLLYKV